MIESGPITKDMCGLDDQVYELIGLTDKFKEKNKLESGRDMIFIRVATINDGKIKINVNTKLEVIRNNKIQSDGASFIGVNTVFVVKVDALDTQTSLSSDLISDKLFGTGSDQVNAKSLFSDCSFGKFQLEPFIGTSTTGEIITNGVGEITMQFDMINKYDDKMESDILKAINKKFGKTKNQFDHLIVVLPKDADEFIAYANMPGHLSVYNDNFISYPTIITHEIGHNLGFDHSNHNKKEYEDEIGVMGFGNTIDDDRKCFNAVKSWDLGWYSAAHKTLDPFNFVFDGQIVGVAEFDKREGRHAIIKISGHNDNKDYFVSFNRMVGINAGSTEDGDKVIVHSNKVSQKTTTVSSKEKILSAGGSFTIDNFGGSGRELHVIVKEVSVTTLPGYAHVLILLKDAGPTNDIVSNNPGSTGDNKQKRDKSEKKDKKGKDKKGGKDKRGEKDKKGKGQGGKDKNKKKVDVKRRRWL